MYRNRSSNREPRILINSGLYWRISRLGITFQRLHTGRQTAYFSTAYNADACDVWRCLVNDVRAMNGLSYGSPREQIARFFISF